MRMCREKDALAGHTLVLATVRVKGRERHSRSPFTRTHHIEGRAERKARSLAHITLRVVGRERHSHTYHTEGRGPLLLPARSSPPRYTALWRPRPNRSQAWQSGSWSTQTGRHFPGGTWLLGPCSWKPRPWGVLQGPEGECRSWSSSCRCR